MSNKDKPAFPSEHIPESRDGSMMPNGLSKREYVAIQIMAGLAADAGGRATREEIANTAVAWTDTLFAELEKEPK